jgi:transposase
VQLNTTDDDAHGLAQIVRTGWSREVRVKSAASHQIRALLSTRTRLVLQRRELGFKLGGLLKTFGRPLGQVGPGRFEDRVRELAAGIETACARRPRRCWRCSSAWLSRSPPRPACCGRGPGGRDLPSVDDGAGRRPLTALAFMTAIDDPERFAYSSSAGAYFGLTPRRSQAGAVDRPGRIAKCGAGVTRRTRSRRRPPC